MRWIELAAAARFRTVRLALRHWADRDVYRRTLERFRHNPTVTEWLDGSAGHWSATEESGWRVWIERPFSYRVETYDEWPPEEPRSVDVTTEPPYGAISTLTTEGGQSLSMEELIEHDQWQPLFTLSVHPMIAELLHPGRLPIAEHPEQPERSTQLELVEETQFTGRQV